MALYSSFFSSLSLSAAVAASAASVFSSALAEAASALSASFPAALAVCFAELPFELLQHPQLLPLEPQHPQLLIATGPTATTITVAAADHCFRFRNSSNSNDGGGGDDDDNDDDIHDDSVHGNNDGNVHGSSDDNGDGNIHGMDSSNDHHHHHHIAFWLLYQSHFHPIEHHVCHDRMHLLSMLVANPASNREQANCKRMRSNKARWRIST